MNFIVLLKKYLSIILIILLCFGNILVNPSFAKANSSSIITSYQNNRDKTEIIVKFKNDSQKENTKTSVKNKLGLSKLQLKKKLSTDIETLELGANDNINNVIFEFKQDSNVEYVQPNYKISLSMTPIDPMFSQQWGLKNGLSSVRGTDINAVKAWDISTGTSNVLVGVLDTGVDIYHEDLRANILQNQREIPGNGLDDDGNGYVDDVFGWDFANNDAQAFDSNNDDTHGTHVAGIIAASSNNLGISGTAPNVKILPLKFISGNSGYTSDAIEAIAYAGKLGVQIINCSWGSSEFNPALEDVMKNSKILFISAAGNNGTTSPMYPASFNLPNVLSVAATDSKGQLASFSNYGSNVKVAAPGVDILSTFPQNTYSKLSGTSMAAPFVTGVASLVLSQNGGYSANQIGTVIEQSVTVMPSLNGKVKTGGTVNAYKALGGIEESQENITTPSTPMPEQVYQPVETVISNPVPPENLPNPEGDTAEQKPEPVEILIPEPVQKEAPLEPNFEIAPFSLSEEEIEVLSNRKAPAPEINSISESLVQENLLDISFLTDRNTTSEIELTQYDKKGKVIDVSSEVYKKADLKVLPTVNHHILFVIDKKAETITYIIKVKDEDGNANESSLKSIDNKTINKDFDKVKRDGNKLYFANDENNNLAGYEPSNNSPSSDSFAGALTIGQYDTMSNALDITSSNIVSYGSGLANYSYINGNTTYVASQNAMTPDSDWYKIFVDKPGQLTILLTPNSSSDLIFYLYDAAGNQLSSGNSGGNGITEYISFNVSNPGNYYIKVWPNVFIGQDISWAYDPVTGTYRTDSIYYYYMYTASGPYSLTAYVNLPLQTISSGTSVNYTIDSATDKDWYSFTLTQKSKANLKLQNIPSGCDYDLSVFQKVGNSIPPTLQGGAYNGSNTSENLNLILNPGTYYVKIYSFSGYSTTAQYNLALATFIPDAYELNESYSQSKGITFGQQLNATIDNTSDQDWFKFSVPQLSKINVKLNNIPSGCDYDLSIYGSSLNSVGGGYRGSNSSEDVTLILNPGDYYLKVYPWAGSNQNSNYSLTLNKYIPDSFELNEYYYTSKAISIGNTIPGTIDNPADQDWYKFTIQNRSKINLNLDGIPLESNYNVSLYNSTLGYLNTNGLYLAGAANKRLWNVLDPGDYFVLVSSAQGYSEQNPYSLTVNSSMPDALELNELSTSATLINMDNEYSATIDNPLDQDWYKVEFTQTGVMQVDIAEIPDACYFYIEVFDSNNQLLRKVETPEELRKQFMCDVLTPGFYYLKVSSNYGYSDSKAYKLSVTRKEKFELALDHFDSNGNIRLALIANNLKNVKNATVIVEYDSNSQELDTIATTTLDFAIFYRISGFKGTAIKTIEENGIKKKVIFYDMENDDAQDMQDQSKLIDYFTFKPLNNMNGSNVVKIMPGSFLTWYDSNVFVQNTEFSITPNAGTQSTLELASPESQNNTINGLSWLDLSKMQKLLDEKPQLRSRLENDERNILGTADSEIDNKILQGGNSIVFSDLVDTASNSSVYGNIRVPAGSFINPESIGVVLRNSYGQTRTTYPNNIGRFGFNQVPIGDYYISVIRDDNLINSINKRKPIIVTGERHIGEVDGEKTILIQELGYYYDTDYNSDGHMGNTDLKEFMDTASSYNVVVGNTLYNSSVTDIMPYSTDTQIYDSNNDNKVDIMDVSNAENASWGDVKIEGNTSVDRHDYHAELSNNTFPSTVSPGESGSFTISFHDNSNMYSEDLFQVVADMFRDQTEVNNCYYHLIRLDSSPIKTKVVRREVIDDGYELNFLESILVTFTVDYWVPSTMQAGSTTTINLGLQNYSQKSIGTSGYNISLLSPIHFGSTKKTIIIEGGTGNPDYSITGMAYNIQRLVDKAIFYKKHIGASSTVDQLVLQYIRRGEVRRLDVSPRYTGGKWPTVAGQINMGFVTYVNNNASDLKNYFHDDVTIIDPKTLNIIDFVHWVATLNAHLYFTSWDDGSGFKETFINGFCPEQHIDNLSGWAGDLQTLLIDVLINTNYSDDYNTLYSKARNLLGTTNPNLQSSFPMDDVLADTDAFNISYRLWTTTLVNAFNSYYSGGYNSRYSKFTVYCPSKEYVRSGAGVYTDDWFVWPIQKWPLLNNVDVTDNQSNAVRDAFTDFIWNHVQLESIL